MKISFIFLFIFSFQLLALNTKAQDAVIELKTNSMTVGQLINEIEKQTNYLVVYSNREIDAARKVDVQRKSDKVSSYLNEAFAGTDISYDFENNYIVLMKKANRNAATVADMIRSAQQQGKTITGKVVDINGEPIIGANIIEVGTNNGTVTNMDGNFSLKVADNATIRVSYIGYVEQEIKTTGKSSFQVTLQENVKSLDEVVVVGYGTQKKVNLTGSVATIESADLANKPVATTSQALAGLATGLSVVQNSGNPGASANVKMRGTGTFSSAGNDPLVLIDGMPSNIDDVNPEDIDNISFLKDAASASIYGNRAANGVILIQTKKGKSGKFIVTYNNTLGWQKPTELPDFLPSWEYATYYNEAMINMGKAAVFTEEQIKKYKEASDPDNYPNVNHLKWLLNSGSGFQQRHTLNIKGGGERISQNLSLGYLKQEGMTAETSNERFSVLLNTNSKLLETLSIDTHLNAYSNVYQSPNGIPSSIEGIIGYAVREPSIIPGRKSDGSFGYQDNYSPEAWLASESFNKNKNINITGAIQLNWETPLKDLSFSGKAGITYHTNYNKSFLAETYFDNSKTVGPTSLSVTSGNNTYQTFEGVLKYDKNIAYHAINIMAGTSLETYRDNSLWGYRNNFPNNYLYELAAGSASSMSNDGSSNEWALLSYFGRFNYSWSDRYLLEINARYDGSSRFAKNNRWGFFPSFSVGWRISEENFWKDLSISNIINNFKIRGSWGVLGNQNIGTYPYQQIYSLGQNSVWGNPATLISGARITTFNNPDITWETTRITDLGIDLSFLNSKSKINVVIDYFDKYTDNILSSVQVTRILGRNVGQSNVGAVSNKGIEFQVEYNANISNNIRFKIAPNFTYVKNAVEKLANGALTDINNNRIVGEPLGIIYGYKTNGLFVNQDEINVAPNQLIEKTALKPGYIRYEDINGPKGMPDGIVDANYDRKVIGCSTPKFYYGLNISAALKRFDFSAILQGLGGYQRLIGSYMAYAFYNGGQIQRWQVDSRWTNENPNKWAKYPRLETLNMNNPNLQVSDYWVRDASFLRIKNVQLGYTFSKNLIEQIGLQNLRIFFSGQNLFNFNSFYQGWDPENEISTGDAPSFYPINSIYSFGINVEF
jgi:TonB-linked SusC/RagA family outer membrane protein